MNDSDDLEPFFPLDESRVPRLAHLARFLLGALVAHGRAPIAESPEWAWQLQAALLGAICEAHHTGEVEERDALLAEAHLLARYEIERYAASQRCGHYPEGTQPYARLVTEYLAKARRAEMAVVESESEGEPC